MNIFISILVCCVLWSIEPQSEHSCPGAVISESAVGVRAVLRSGDRELWLHLLRCAFVRTDACRAELEEAAASETTHPAVLRLAELLLEEWLVLQDQVDSADPVRVWNSMPPPDELAQMFPPDRAGRVVVLSGKIGADGGVSKITVLRSSGFEDVDGFFTRVFSKSLYRPARERDGYVERRIEVVYRLHIR